MFHSPFETPRGRKARGAGRGRGAGQGLGEGRGEMRRHGQRQGSGRRGGGLGRLFAHGDLRFLVLKLIAEKPRHGYEIIKAIEESLEGAYTPSPGVVYPTLAMLEELGWIAPADEEGAKKPFAITGEGELALQANRATLDAIEARMAEVRNALVAMPEDAEEEGEPGPGRSRRDRRGLGRHVGAEVRRAMVHLTDAVRGHIDENPARAEAISTILDEAAAKIRAL